MDKPVSLSLKSWIIRKMSVNMMIKESVIETVVNHQFESAFLAMEKNDSIEISGFCKFYFNRKKAIKKLEKMVVQIAAHNNIINKPESTDVKKRNSALKIQTFTRNYEILNKRLNES